MSETVKRWEGRTVDEKYQLRRYLGNSDHSAVFLTLTPHAAAGSEKAALKLIPADADADRQLERWNGAGQLNHSNLLRILDSGRDGAALLYVVEELAEENLAQILPERALTAEEAHVTLPPVLLALQFVHEKGYVHGRIQPSNILAIGDHVKLSSDSLTALGDSPRSPKTLSPYDPPEAGKGEISEAGDVWQFGMTLVEVLTQRLPVWDRTWRRAPQIPAEMPEPFREIAECCLQIDPRKRWTSAQIMLRLGAEWPEEQRLRA
ncbi:MAG: protein kinase [Terriglobales bacterium]